MLTHIKWARTHTISRFATEYILRRDEVDSVAINVVPDTQARSEAEQDVLQSFTPSTHDLKDFSTIIAEAASAMGIGSTKTFASDVLRIEISGPSQPHLTLVDLPGLFFSRSKDQTDDDKEAVFSLVGSYISRQRSIILAVVTAKNDLNNQVVLNFARFVVGILLPHCCAQSSKRIDRVAEIMIRTAIARSVSSANPICFRRIHHPRAVSSNWRVTATSTSF